MYGPFDILVYTRMLCIFVSRVIPYNRHPNQALRGLRAAAAATTTCSTPNLSGTLLLLHSKPCWDTAPAPALPPTSSKNEPHTLLLLLSPGSSPVAQNPWPSYFFSTVIRVAHSSERIFFWSPRVMALISTRNLSTLYTRLHSISISCLLYTSPSPRD